VRHTLTELPERPRYPSSSETGPNEVLSRAFSSYGQVDKDLMNPLGSYLTRVTIPRGVTIWRIGDPADSLYIIESGVLRATYRFPAGSFSESMVSGTLAGELSFMSDTPRNTEVVVEKQAVVWKLTREEMLRLERERPEFAKTFVRLVLKGVL
jgi:sulfate permease, SulP family